MNTFFNIATILALLLVPMFLLTPHNIQAQVRYCTDTVDCFNEYTCQPGGVFGYECVWGQTCRTTGCVCDNPNACNQCTGFRHWNATCVAGLTGCTITTDTFPITCPGPFTSTPPPGSTPPPPPPGWGECGSCGNCDNNPPGSGGHPSSECRLDPSNNCVWDISCRGLPPPPTPTPPPLPTCTIDLNPNGVDVNTGATADIVASTTSTNGTVSQVAFQSSDTVVATVNPGTDTTSPFATQVTGVGLGSATITATATVTGPGGTSTCNTGAATDSDITVTAPGAWWQAINADVGGDILISLIPTTTCTGACVPNLILDGAGGYPGVASYTTSYDFAAGSSQGTASSKNWLTQSPYRGKVYDYDYFARQIPADVTINELTSDTINAGTLNSGGTPSRGYIWYRRTGNLTINGNVNLVGSRKVVLLVDGGNLTINGRINLQSPGNGFFMAIVGRADNGLRGDIIVDGTVSHPNQPELQGVFVADGELKIFAGSEQLHVKGMVVAWDRVVLRRDLGANNDDTPAHVFEYDPTLLFTFPREFFRNRLVWREVAP